MKLLNLLLLFSFVLIANSWEIFHDPRGLINVKRRLFCRDEPKPECLSSCALQKAELLTPSGNDINRTMFGPMYSKYAEKCFDFTSMPTCEEAEKFVTCFDDKAEKVVTELMNKCKERFPVGIIWNYDLMTVEDLERVENLACFTVCLTDPMHVFNEDDTINLDVFSPHRNPEFDAVTVVRKCETQNKQDGKCIKRASLFLCLLREHKISKERYVASLQTAKPFN